MDLLPLGSYSDKPKALVCTACQMGQYQDEAGQTKCMPCETG